MLDSDSNWEVGGVGENEGIPDGAAKIFVRRKYVHCNAVESRPLGVDNESNSRTMHVQDVHTDIVIRRQSSPMISNVWAIGTSD